MGAFEDAFSAFEQIAGPLLADELSTQAPYVTGALANSMGWQDDGTGTTLELYSDDPDGPIAAYVTRGTAPHEIVPVNAEFLHFFGSDGGEVFTKHVNHPGTQPNPFHIAAWQAQQDTVLQQFRETMGSGVALAYLNPWKNRTINL